jgi:O-antigen ligase
MVSRSVVPGPWSLALLGAATAVGLLAGSRPLLSVAVALGLLYAVLSLLDVRAGLCLFTMVTFLEVLPTPAVSLTKIAGLVLGLAWLAATTADQGQRQRGLVATHPGAAWLLGALLAWAAVSMVWAPSPSEATGALSRYGLNAALFVIVYNVVRTPRDLEWVVAAFVAGAGVSAAYGLIVPPSAATGEALERAAGTIGDPNEFAAVLVPALPLSLALAAGTRSPTLRWLGVAAAGLTAAGTALSLSRGGLLALGTVLVIGVLVAGRWRGAVILIALFIALSGVSYFLFAASLTARERVTSAEGGTGRSDLWRVGWRMFEDRPLLGVGAGNFATASIDYLLRPGQLRRSDLIANTPKVAHNTYLGVLAELGVVGGIGFMGLMCFALGCGVRGARAFARARDGPMEMLCRAWLAAIAGVLAADFFISAQFSKQLWLLLALGPCLLALARARRGPSFDPREGSPSG